MSIISYIKSRFDSFANLKTGFNTARDHGVQTQWYIQGQQLTKEQIDDFHALHELAWKITATGPVYGLRNWIDFPKLDENDKKTVCEILDDCKFREKLKQAAILNNAYGALLYISLDDGLDDIEPINKDRIRGIMDIQIIERDYIRPKYTGRSLRHDVYIVDIQNDDGSVTSLDVHRSRIIRIPGATVSADWLIRNNGWPPSKLERAYAPLRDLSLGYSLLPNLVKDIVRDVVKIAGLVDLAQDCEGERKFGERLDFMFQAQSLINKLVLDKDDEYIRQVTSINGVSDLIRLLERRAVSVSGWPHSFFLGESPGNSIGGQSGDSQDRDLNKAVECYQEDELRCPIEEMLEIVEAITGLEIDFVFNPLSSESTETKAKNFKTMAEAVAILSDRQLIDSSEAISPFSGNELKVNIVLDEEARQMLAEQSINPEDTNNGREEAQAQSESES